MRFEIEGGAFNASERAEIRAAAAMWNTYAPVTGITLVEVRNLRGRDSAIRIQNALFGSCRSEVGRRPRLTKIRLSDSCLGAAGRLVAHEFGHALGLGHEMERSDADDHTVWFDEFTERAGGQFNQVNSGSRRWDNVGRYDIQSLMQYPTGGFAVKLRQQDDTRVALANTLSRQHWTSWGFIPTGSPFPSIASTGNDWASMVKIGSEFVDIDTSFVWDVNRDGRDDILTIDSSDSTSFHWSPGGNSGWIEARAHDIGSVSDLAVLRTARLTHTSRPWTVESIGGGRIAFTPTAGTLPGETVDVGFDPVDFEVADFIGDAADDVLLVAPNGSWHALRGDLAALNVPTTTELVRAAKGAVEIELVKDVEGSEPRLVAFLDDELQISTTDGPWERLVFSVTTLPPGINSIDEIVVGHFDAPPTDSDAGLDILTFSTRRFEDEGQRNESIDWPYIMRNVRTIDGSAGEAVFLVSEQAFDMSAGVLIGAFGSDTANMLSFVSRGRIITVPQNPVPSMSNFVAWSDAGAIGVYEELSGSSQTRLTDRYPQTYNSLVPVCDIHAPMPFSGIYVGAEFSLYAGFMSQTSVGDISILVDRWQGTSYFNVSSQTVSFAGERASVDFPFMIPSEGSWRVRIAPATPSGLANEVSTWEFRTMPSCGDFVVDPDETCDDGDKVAGDGCNASCQREICGNGVVDTGEECDDGNVFDSDGCSSTCIIEADPLCGNGVVDAGEFCDDGNQFNEDLCRANCLSGCGDGIVEPPFESCDELVLPSAFCDAACFVILE